MEITTKRLKQIIKEEKQRLDEMEHYSRGSKQVSGMISELAEKNQDVLIAAIRNLPASTKEAIRRELGIVPMHEAFERVKE